MKWIHQVDSAFGSIVMYSPTDMFIAWEESKDMYSWETAKTCAWCQNRDRMKSQMSEWLRNQNTEFVRVIAATGTLRTILRDLKPILFM